MYKLQKVRKKIVSIIGLGLLIIASLYVIKSSINKTQPPTYQVATTIFPIYDITKEITKDNLNVLLILPPNASPHTYSPLPSTISAMQNVKVTYAVGYGIDNWIDPIINTTSNQKIIVNKNINLKTEDGAIDPHYWLTIKNGKKIATYITQDLEKRFPEYKQDFENNLQDLILKMDTADEEIKKDFGALLNKNIITLHDSWQYFADEYQLTILASFEPTPGKEPTAKYISKLTDTISATKVKTIYSEPQLSIQKIKQFAKDNDLTIAQLDPIGGTDDKNSFIQLIKYNAKTITNNQ